MKNHAAEFQVQTARFQRELLRHALAASGGKIGGESGAARQLGIEPTYVHRLLKKFGIEKR